MNRSLRALVPALFFLSGVLYAAEPVAADWPGWLGPKANGFTTDKGLNRNWSVKPPKELWRAKVSAGYSGIAAADGIVVLMDHEGQQGLVRAFSLASGEEVWRFAYDDAAKENYGFDRATPAFDGDHVYCFTRLGRLFCLDTKTGAKIWSSEQTEGYSARAMNSGYGHAASPLIDGNAIIVLTGGRGGYLMKLDKLTGKLINKGGGDEWPSYATPVLATIGGVRQYVVLSGFRIAGIDRTSGEVLWKYPWESPSNLNIPTPIVVGDSIIVVAGGRSSLLDLEGTAVKPRWLNKALTPYMVSPLYKDGFLYGCDGKKYLVCLDAETGVVQWKQGPFGDWFPLIGFEDVGIVQDGSTGEAILVVLAPDAGDERGRLKPFAQAGKYWNSPIIAGGRLIMRGPEELVCFDLL